MLETTVGSLKLRNPLILAAGIMGTSFSSLRRMYNCGFGAMVTKSIGILPNKGYKNPSVILLPETHSAINAVGLANPGVEEFGQELRENLTAKLPIIYSIYSNSSSDIKAIVTHLNQLNPFCYEINVSCPHGGKFGLSVCNDKSLFENIVKTAKDSARCPIWVKISPNAINICDFAQIAIDGGADGIVAINTLKALAIDIDIMQPLLSNKFGGLSGQAIKPVGVRAIYDLYTMFGDKIPLIGVGGIQNAADVIEYLLAGASAVQLGTALAYTSDYQLFIRQILENLTLYLEKKNFSHIEEIIGRAH